MENEILEYIDDVRAEYPEVVAEDEPIIIQSNPDIEESYIYQELEEPVLAISENKIENINEFKTKGVIDSEIKSDVFVLNSIPSDRAISDQSFDLINYDSFDIWNNSNINSYFNLSYINIGDFDSYDLIGIVFCQDVNNTNNRSILYVPSAYTDFGSYYSSYGSGLYYSSNAIWLRYMRNLILDGNDCIEIGPCKNLYNGAVNNNNNIPVKIIGYKSKTLSSNDIPNNNQQIVSGNIINNNFYFCTSGNSVSNNIMTKNINDYTVGESLSLMIFLGLLVAGMVYTIKKSIFKW